MISNTLRNIREKLADAGVSPLLLLAPLALLFASFFWVQQKTDNTNIRVGAQVARTESRGPTYVVHSFEERRPDRGDRRRRHHGPPPHHGVPPTVLFLVGGALGYLLGNRKRHCGHHHRPHRPYGPQAEYPAVQREQRPD